MPEETVEVQPEPEPKIAACTITHNISAGSIVLELKNTRLSDILAIKRKLPIL